MEDKAVSEAIKLALDTAKIATDVAIKTDKINHRLTMLCVAFAAAIAVIIIGYCMRDIFVSHNYFYGDYGYGTVEQYQDGEVQKQSINAESEDSE